MAKEYTTVRIQVGGSNYTVFGSPQKIVIDADEATAHYADGTTLPLGKQKGASSIGRVEIRIEE